jgi:hypothetical protein
MSRDFFNKVVLFFYNGIKSPDEPPQNLPQRHGEHGEAP